jgi:thiol:disulfide interchange protein
MNKLISTILMITAGVIIEPAHANSLSLADPQAIGQLIGTHGAPVYLALFFGLGILLAFTPCVLPMIPILSGIIVGQDNLTTGRSFRLSLSYVTGMAVTYAVAGMLAGYLGSTVQTMMQQPWVIISFSLVFLLLGLSMFGLFEIRMPAWLQPRMQRGQGGLIAAGLMGILSTLIVSPCVTAPLIAVLTFISQSGQTGLGGLLLFVMALGMGLPLLLVGAGYGRFLPKSGAWMIRIKQLFGIIMLLLAVWMVARIIPIHTQTPTGFTMVYSMQELTQELAQAKEKHQPVFVEFYAGWCSDCRAMDAKVFNQPEIIQAMQGSVNLRVDISDKSPAVASIRQIYGILGVPAMRFYNSNGELIPDLLSHNQLDKQQMLELLNQFTIRTGS